MYSQGSEKNGHNFLSMIDGDKINVHSVSSRKCSYGINLQVLIWMFEQNTCEKLRAVHHKFAKAGSGDQHEVGPS